MVENAVVPLVMDANPPAALPTVLGLYVKDLRRVSSNDLGRESVEVYQVVNKVVELRPGIQLAVRCDLEPCLRCWQAYSQASVSVST